VTLRTRIAAAAGLAVAVAVLAATAIVYVAIRSELRGEVERALRDRVEAIARAPGPALLESGRRGGRFGRRLEPDADAQPFGGAEGYAQVLLGGGLVVRPPDATASLPVTARASAIAEAGRGEDLADQHVAGTHLLVLTVGAGGGAIQAARPLDEVDAALDRVLLILLVVGAVGIALAAVLGAVVARTALRPISRFTARTEALAADPDPSLRIEAEGQDELARLARSFNATLDALERSVEAQRHLVADASHELRTPLASLRANVQVLEQADRLPAADRAALHADILEELDALTALVGDVVELARGARPAEAPDDVRLDELVAALAERAQRRAGDAVALRVRTEPTVVRGDAERIGRAVSNLLGNAIKWSPPGGEVEVALAGGVVEVRDHGPGFDPRDLPHVFERFYRAAEARGMAGSGLGLAIVRQAAEAHGGEASAANAPGGGALLRVSFGPPLPMAQPAGAGTAVPSP
jgi:two-component system, OmpR family, sensor histidine kinase MprB